MGCGAGMVNAREYQAQQRRNALEFVGTLVLGLLVWLGLCAIVG